MILRPALVIGMVILMCGCSRKEITSLDREQAANKISEAEFAVNIHELSRAEGLYAQAAELCPDNGDYWMALGVTRVHNSNRSGARSAYKSAVSAYKDALDVPSWNPQTVVHLAYALVILGRQDEARSAIARAHSKHPEDRFLTEFVERGELDKVIADPGLKDISP